MNKHGVAGVLGLTFAGMLGLTSVVRPPVAFGADDAFVGVEVCAEVGDF